MSNGTLKTNNYLSPREWKAILVKWIKTPNITKPHQRAMPRRLGLAEAWANAAPGMSLGGSTEGGAGSLACRALGRGQRIFRSRPSSTAHDNWRPLRLGLFIYCPGCSSHERYQWKIKAGQQSVDLFAWHISLRFFKVHSGCLPKTIFKK